MIPQLWNLKLSFCCKLKCLLFIPNLNSFYGCRTFEVLVIQYTPFMHYVSCLRCSKHLCHCICNSLQIITIWHYSLHVVLLLHILQRVTGDELSLFLNFYNRTMYRFLWVFRFLDLYTLSNVRENWQMYICDLVVNTKLFPCLEIQFTVSTLFKRQQS